MSILHYRRRRGRSRGAGAILALTLLTLIAPVARANDDPLDTSTAVDAERVRIRMSQNDIESLPGAQDATQVAANAQMAVRYEYQFRVVCSGTGDQPGRTAICAEAVVACDGAPGPLTAIYRRDVLVSGEEVRGWHLIGNTCYPGSRLGRPTVTVTHIREAFAAIPWAGLSTGMQPPNNITLVTVPVFYQVQWATEGLSPGEAVSVDPARMLGYHVDIRPVLVGYTYHFGDGTGFGPTPDPGGTYPNGGITHPYAKAGTYAVRIDATLGAEFRIEGGAWTRIGDTATVRGIPTSMLVKTARAVLVDR